MNRRGLAGVAALAAAAMLATTFFGIDRVRTARPVLQAVGAVGPGSLLTLQTQTGPMQLTVDSEMNQGGYVHAYGYENGQMYAGYVQLSAQNEAAQQALVQAPTNAQAQLAQYPPSNPYSRQVAYNAAEQQWGGQTQQKVDAQAPTVAPGTGLQLHVGPNGGVMLNGQHVVPSDSKTAAILRLLAKRTEAQHAGLAGGSVKRLSSGWHAQVHSKLDSEITRAKRLVQKLETVRAERGDARKSMLVAKRSVRRRHEREGHEPRAAIWAAMQSLMHSVDRIEKKQNQMDKVVTKVSKVMKYDPFPVSTR